MKNILWMILIAGLVSCSYRYISTHGEEAGHTLVSQIKQIHDKNKFFAQYPTRPIFIQAIITRKKDNIGVYRYNSNSTHFGRVEFFMYKDNQVILLDRNNLDSLQSAVKKFLHDNDFSKRQQQTTKNRVENIWNINSTDVF